MRPLRPGGSALRICAKSSGLCSQREELLLVRRSRKERISVRRAIEALNRRAIGSLLTADLTVRPRKEREIHEPLSKTPGAV